MRLGIPQMFRDKLGSQLIGYPALGFGESAQSGVQCLQVTTTRAKTAQKLSTISPGQQSNQTIGQIAYTLTGFS